MEDDDIRAALRELGEVRLGVRKGYLRVMREDLARRGIDFDEAARWVEARGGFKERSEHRRTGIGPSYGQLDVFVCLIVPEEALRD